MRRVGIYLMTIIIMLSLCACGNSSKNESETELVLTAEEKQLLIDSFYMDEDDKLRMQEGKIYDGEEKCILNSRATLQYLEEKYPGIKFTIVLYETPSFLGTAAPIIYYTDDSDSDKTYTISLSEDDNGEIIFADNYYGTLIRESYDEYFMELLNENGFENCITYTTMEEHFGMEVNGDTSVEEILKLDAHKKGYVFVEGSAADGETIAKAVEQLIRDEGMYGFYLVYVLEDIDSISSDAEELLTYVRDNEEKFISRMFNTWTEMED